MATAASDAARLHALIARWPQRADLISRLDKLLALPRIPDVLVYGPACTGKTSVVRDMLSARPHAYVRCGPQSSRLRPVLAAVVAQLAGRKRRREHGYAPTAGAVVVQAQQQQQSAAAIPPTTTTATTTVVSGSASAPEAQLLWELRRLCPASAPTRVIVLDDVQALPPAQAQALLRAVLRLRDHAGANVAVLLVCGADGAATALLGTLPPLQTVRFPPYDAAQLLELLARDAPAPPPALLAAGEERALAATGGRRGNGNAAANRRGSTGSADEFYDAEEEERNDNEDDDDDEEAPTPFGAYRTFLASFVLPAAALYTSGGAGALPQLRALAAAVWPAYGRALAAHPCPLSQDAQLAAHAAARPVAAAALRAFEPGLCGGSGARGAAEASAQRAGLGGWAGADARVAEALLDDDEETGGTEEEEDLEEDEEEEDAGGRSAADNKKRRRKTQRGGSDNGNKTTIPPLTKARLRAEAAARVSAVIVPPLDQAELQLPRAGKLLLVAAYLASRNRASLDRQLFDAGASAADRGGAGAEGGGGAAGGGGGRRRGGGARRRVAGGSTVGARPGGAAMGQDRHAEAAREAALRGPHSFPLQRLMALYRVLRQASSAAACDADDAGGVFGAGAAAASGLIGGRSLFAGAGAGAGAEAAIDGGNSGGGGAMLASFVRRQQRQQQQVQQQQKRSSPMDADGADLLHEVASLVAARLLSAASVGGSSGGGTGAGDEGNGGGRVSAAAADAALDAPRFRCDAPPGLVQRCAVELGVNLASLLRYV